MKTLTNPFFVEMERGARRAESELDLRLSVRTAAQETSIQQQIAIVSDLIKESVDAIVIAPGDSLELVPMVGRAIEAGIVVINIDNRLDPELVEKLGIPPIPFISVDNEHASYRAVSYLIRDISEPTAAALIEGIRSAANAEARKQGALRAFADNPAVQVVAQETANWKIDEGYRVTGELFAQHPEIEVLYCANDMMALGAIRYLQDAGRRDVRVGGYDALDDAMPALRQGWLQVTIDQQADRQGYLGMQYAWRALQGESLPLETLIETRLLTASDLE